MEGEDVVQLLEQAIGRRDDVKIKVCAVLNDTTGTLMSCAWKKHDTYVGLIIEFDREIDQLSINPGRQVFEKMISGMYMGELVRPVLQRLTKRGLLFGGLGSEQLGENGSFYTRYVTEVESDSPGDYTNCRLVLEELGLEHATDEDCENVRYVCELVSRRAAFLVGTDLAVRLNKMARPSVTVGVDGSVYRFHPHVHNLMCEQINRLIQPALQFELMLSEDGSGRGAALVAAVASRTNS